jgi:hypothetical protein
MRRLKTHRFLDAVLIGLLRRPTCGITATGRRLLLVSQMLI